MISLFHEHCGDDECRRHRVLAGYPASLWIRAAFGFVLTFGMTGDWTMRTKASVLGARQARHARDYMPAVVAGVAGRLGDPVVYQWPGRAFAEFGQKPDSPWVVIVRASGAVEVHGDREMMLREFHEECRRGSKLYRPQDDADLRELPVTVWIYFPPCCYGLVAQEHRPWWVDAPTPKWSVLWSGDLVVKVTGSIPESARAFWEELAQHTPTCEDR